MMHARTFEEFEQTYNDQFGDQFDDQHYDAFLKKWMSKRAVKRKASPKVIAGKTKRNEKKIIKGKSPIRFFRKATDSATQKVFSKKPVQPPKGHPANSITAKDLSAHIKGHAAMQNEHKTMQAEAKTEIMEAEAAKAKLGIEKEALENKKLQSQIRMAAVGKVGLVIGLLLLGGWLWQKGKTKNT